jgi:quercetin dioxygenase-like cupin family protein
VELEVSYQYGMERFEEFGGVILNFVNRSYCKKMIVLLPGQTHPEQYHKRKEETFNILHGDAAIALDGVRKKYKPGDMVLVERGVKHSFSSQGGCIIEEISSTHYRNDSYYTDKKITKNKNRKTVLTYWVN